MSKYTIDGKVFSTDRAQNQWNEDTYFDGHNHISVATGSQWDHETLYLSVKGRYWIEWVSQRQGTTPKAYVVSDETAAAWLLQNNHELPADLKDIGTEIEE